MNAGRCVAHVATLTMAALGTGFLIGYPAEVGAATAVAFAAGAGLVTTRDLAVRTRSHAPPVRRVVDYAPPEQLRRVGKALAAAEASEFGFDRDLRPILRSIAAMRLARRGIDLDRHHQEARARLGDTLWELVRADRPRPANLRAGGMSAAELQSLIERLERI